MKKILLATVSVLALSAATRAADVPAKARAYVPDSIPLWAGGYLGIQGGVARHDALFNDLNCFATCGSINSAATGGAMGGLLGYSWQQGDFVYGLEGDWNWLNAKAGHNSVIPGNFGVLSSFDVNWLATVRGRAGLAMDATFIYITGGAAFGNVKNSLDSFESAGNLLGSFSHDRTKIGWTVGAGIEHMFSPHWIARAEFRYVGLGTTTVSCTPKTSTVCPNYRGEFSNTLMMGLVGLNYKF